LSNQEVLYDYESVQCAMLKACDACADTVPRTVPIRKTFPKQISMASGTVVL